MNHKHFCRRFSVFLIKSKEFQLQVFINSPIVLFVINCNCNCEQTWAFQFYDEQEKKWKKNIYKNK